MRRVPGSLVERSWLNERLIIGRERIVSSAFATIIRVPVTCSIRSKYAGAVV